MHVLDDAELLSAYATQHSEEAFATLVERHVHWSIRRLAAGARPASGRGNHPGGVHHSGAQGRNRWAGKTVLSGWLYHTARYGGANALTAERRRQRREQEAYMQSTLNEPDADEAWEQLAPLLDEAMAQLGEPTATPWCCAFSRTKAAGGSRPRRWALNEDAAQKRVSRALEKLRKFFRKRGVRSTAAIIAGAISANSVQAAPVALAKTVTAVALAKGAAAGGSTLTLIKGALKIMAWTKAKTAVVTGVVLFWPPAQRR